MTNTTRTYVQAKLKEMLTRLDVMGKMSDQSVLDRAYVSWKIAQFKKLAQDAQDALLLAETPPEEVLTLSQERRIEKGIKAGYADNVDEVLALGLPELAARSCAQYNRIQYLEERIRHLEKRNNVLVDRCNAPEPRDEPNVVTVDMSDLPKIQTVMIVHTMLLNDMDVKDALLRRVLKLAEDLDKKYPDLLLSKRSPLL